VAETHEIRTAYAEFLQSKEWDYFATVTCRKPRTDTLAFARDLGQITPGIGMPGVRAFWAIEPHRTGMLHAHGLLYYREDFTAGGRPLPHPGADALQSKFGRVFGRSRVDTINSRENVSLYCAKYVTRATSRGFEYQFQGEGW
jgi:hypothetical protein